LKFVYIRNFGSILEMRGFSPFNQILLSLFDVSNAILS